ncbi:hypothetical protein Athai_18900 [Actinocatenispora thailandica]|uniref:Uncharacterized protein n=1 Tax=Actinocatenispora thailandica TaxID=227318 RepID=A0A7R7HVP4_9ACTN|nr:hypothetical protein [Actinocatenispora thailandica]BCJ34387.1 hypothetical protein Athai_18900 [Actinocatenispora thailandica]
MNELGQLYEEATATSRPASAQAVTQRIQRRFRRRRAGRFGVGALAAAALVLGGVAWHGGGATPPAPIDTAAQLPANRPVGRGEYLQPYFANDGTPRNALLRTRSGSRYVVPGQVGPSVALMGTPLSPNGRWLVTYAGTDVVVRDLTGNRSYRTGRAGKDGIPVAWSSNDRWLVLRGAPDGNRVDDTLFRVDLRNGAVRKLALGAHHSAAEIAAILPSGEPVFEVPGSKPTPKPTKAPQQRYGTGIYQVVDPGTGALRKGYSVPNAQLWQAEDVARIDPASPKHTPRLAWVAQTRSPLILSPDATQGAAVTTQYGRRTTLRLGVLDVTGGVGRAVNVVISPNGTAADGISAVREWRPVTLDHGKLTVLGRTGSNAYVVRLTIDLAAHNAVAVDKIHYPEDSLPAGVVSTAR